MKILAVVVTWTGCLLPYLASRRQKLTQFSLPRPIAGAGFCGSLVLATVLLGSTYNTVSAVLLVLMCVMCIWPGVILATPHLHKRPVLLNALGMLMLTMIMAVG